MVMPLFKRSSLMFIVVICGFTTNLFSADLTPEMTALKAKMEKYKDTYKAVHDGYFSTVGCVQYPDGDMGIHFFNPALVGPVPDPMNPQVLMYEPSGDSLRLVGVEWLIPVATGVQGRPQVFGQAFEGPMEGHEPLLPKELVHYDLHLWLFKDNPLGLFHHSNPDVDCSNSPFAIKEEPTRIVE